MLSSPAEHRPIFPPMDVFDPQSLLGNLGGDRDLAVEIVDVLRSSAPTILENVRTAAAAGDTEALRKSAHQLKGALASVGAHASSEAAARLERFGREPGKGDVAAAINALECEMRRLEPELDAFMDRA